MTYNHTIYAVLGALTTDCRTGYAIKQLIDRSLSHFWKISYGQIYPALKQLVADDLARIEQITEEGKPQRNEYKLTEKGSDVLKKWLEKPIEHIPTEKNEVLFKLFFARHLPLENTIRHLREYKKMLQTQYNTYNDIERMLKERRAGDTDLIYWLITLDYGKRTTKAAIEWAEVTLDKFSKRE